MSFMEEGCVTSWILLLKTDYVKPQCSVLQKVEKLNKESQISFQKNDHFLGLKLGLGP